MGYFKDAFDLSAGATLGNLTVNAGAQLGAALVDAQSKQAYINYRSQYFDPIIRHDLDELLVFERLPQLAYPFPKSSEPIKKENFFKRHKVFTALLITELALEILISILGVNGSVDDLFENLLLGAFFLMMGLFLYGVVIAIKKVGKTGKKVLTNYKTQLEYDGQQYWYVREYARQALAKGEMDTKTAITKISNTSLARQFPDTVDEIEASAFYYRQVMGKA